MGVGETESFLATTLLLAAYIVFIFFMDSLSDRFGRKRMLIAASILFIVLTVPLFSALGTMGFVGIVAIQIGFGALLTMNDGTLPCFLSEIFPTTVRYSGFAFTFNTANALFGGTVITPAGEQLVVSSPSTAALSSAEPGQRMPLSWRAEDCIACVAGHTARSAPNIASQSSGQMLKLFARAPLHGED